MQIYDLIIIGAGPAGITASVYAARQKINFLLLSRDIGGQAAWSGDIENYTGYQFISGPELVQKFEEHLRKYEIKLKENENVLELKKTGGLFSVKTDKEVYLAKCVIIASGKKSQNLGVPGEAQYKNRGLTYCAVCDGPLFAAKVVAVIGGGNSALDAAAQLIKIAKHVYIVNNTDRISGDKLMLENVFRAKNITVFNRSQVLSITGERFVKAIKILNEGRQLELAVEGVFVEIGLVPNSDFAPSVRKNSIKEIIIGKNNQTSVRGIFAAGDVTDVPEKQIIIACGEGSKAALSAFNFLNRQKISDK